MSAEPFPSRSETSAGAGNPDSRLLAVLRLLAATVVLAIPLIGAAELLGDGRLAAGLIAMALLLAAGVLASMSALRHGQERLAALGLAYALLVTALVTAAVEPRTVPVLAFVPFLSIAIARPYLQRSALSLLFACGFLAAAGVPAVATVRDKSDAFIPVAIVALGLPVPFGVLWLVGRGEERRLSAAIARERELHDVLESIPQLAWITDENGVLVWVNRRWCDYTGLSREALLGERRWRVALHPEDLERCLRPWQEALRDHADYEAQYRLRDASGGYRWHLARARSELDAAGHVVRWVGTCTDIDDQKRAEEAIKVTADRFRHLALATSQVIWTVGADGEIREDSPSWRDFTGQTPEQARGPGFWDAIHPDDRERAREVWNDALARKVPHAAEVRIRRRDGSWAETLVRGVPVFAPDGTLREWVGANTDISDRKRAERQQLEESRRKDEFLAMLGHELRNPLAPILTSVAVLKRTAHGDFRHVEVIERQAMHMARLVDDLLDVSRIRSGRVQLRCARLELIDAVERAIESSRPLLESRRHRLIVDVPTTGLAVQGDLVRLSQVLSNLLQNAAKYTDPGGEVRITGRRESDRVVLSVCDDGIGIDAEMLPVIFDLFVQGKRSLDRGTGGLGLGLSIVRRLVEMHGGTVEARSEGRGRGTEMVVRLPASLPAAPTGADPGDPPADRRPGRAVRRLAAPSEVAAPVPAPGREAARSVLVVDDNVDAALTTEVFLQLAGLTVDVAHDGATALAVAKRRPPDVVLLDIGLPGLDGYEVARRLRADPALANTRLVALTGYGQASDRARAHEAGFDAHLVKPASGEALLAEVTRPARGVVRAAG